MSRGQAGDSRLWRGQVVAMVTGVRGQRSWDGGFPKGARTCNTHTRHQSGEFKVFTSTLL